MALDEPEGIPDCLFLNAQNKQTIHEIVFPLRMLGVPCAAIVDIDVIKEGGDVFTRNLEAVKIPRKLHQALQNQRKTVNDAFQKTGKCMKKDGGIELLGTDDKPVFEKLADDLAQYGFFILRNGEIETWLRHLGVNEHGPLWLVPIFEKMGTDPESPDYVRPETDDVWGFMREIANWTRTFVPS